MKNAEYQAVIVLFFNVIYPFFCGGFMWSALQNKLQVHTSFFGRRQVLYRSMRNHKSSMQAKGGHES
jgi:hypothetical protein